MFWYGSLRSFSDYFYGRLALLAAIVGPGVTFIEFLCESPPTGYMSVGGVCPAPPIPDPDPVPVCEALPIAGCRQVTRARASRLMISRGGSAARNRVRWSWRRGANLALPTMPLDQDTTVTVQAVNSIGECWSAQYSAPARTNTADRFVGRSD